MSVMTSDAHPVAIAHCSEQEQEVQVHWSRCPGSLHLQPPISHLDLSPLLQAPAATLSIPNSFLNFELDATVLIIAECRTEG